MSGGFSQVSVSDVSRHFGRRRALTRVSFTVHAGEVVALMGANGAGKSTLLSILAAFLQPSSGEVRYGDLTAVQQGSALRAQIGWLAHDLYLYPELSARENLAFFARLYGLDGVQHIVEAALEHAELTRRADEGLATFSRGMRQRLALERSLLHNPALILLDEPFTGLDERSTESLIARLRALRADGRLVIVATHDLDLAEQISDRALVLRHGSAIALETGRGVLRQRYREAMA